MRKVLAASFVVTTVLAVILFVPVLFETEVLSPICELGVVNAQDNPCLAQEATLAVLGLQATIDAGNYQATIEALESSSDGVNYQATIVALNNQLATAQAGGSVATSVPSSGLPFEESFSNNVRGWSLTQQSGGVVRFSQGQLTISVEEGEVVWLPVPELTVSDEFYAEVRATATDDSNNGIFLGFALGNAATGQYHMFTVGESASIQDYSVSFFEQTSILFSTPYDRVFTYGEPFSLGLEALGGLYTLYVNGQVTESAQIVPYGNNIGVVVYNCTGCGRLATGFFDNLIIREVR